MVKAAQQHLYRETPRPQLSLTSNVIGEPQPAVPEVGPNALSLLSVVIPVRDEEGCIQNTVELLHQGLCRNKIPHEILVVDDASSDRTWEILSRLKANIPNLVAIRNTGEHGFGRAIITGLDATRGDAVVIMMGDDSDDPHGVVRYWEILNQGWDCVFGSRFIPGGAVIEYPKFKLAMNRLANSFLRILFAMPLNDTTNGFKAYRREVIDACRPLTSRHFNLTVELPLKAIVRGYTWTTIPITYRNRKAGVSKWSLLKMSGRYLATSLSVWMEKQFGHKRGNLRHRSSNSPSKTQPAVRSPVAQ
jgi:dolichol-phosphate mannosyltransferase